MKRGSGSSSHTFATDPVRNSSVELFFADVGVFEMRIRHLAEKGADMLLQDARS